MKKMSYGKNPFKASFLFAALACKKQSTENRRLKIIGCLFAIFFFMTLPAWAGINIWTSNGPYGGSVGPIGISPNYLTDHTVFISGSGGGIYKSIDAGQTWSQSGLAGQGVQSLAISPNYGQDNTIYAGTTGNGVFKSIDGGQHWTQTGIVFSNPMHVALSPNYSTDGTVFVGEVNRLYISTDRLESYTTVAISTYSLAISPNYIQDHIVLIGNDQGVYKSSDGGQTWTQILATSYRVDSIAISPNYSQDNTIFAGIIADGIYKSTNGGATWTQSGFIGSTISSVTISPTYANDNTLFINDSGGCSIYTTCGVYKSTDSGQTWTHVTNNVLVNVIAISPSYTTDLTLFAGTYTEGLLKSTDDGQNWSQVNNGLIQTYIYSLVISPSYGQDKTIFAGLANNQGIYKSTDEGQTWSQSDLAESVQSLAISPNYNQDKTIFAGLAYNHGVYKSTDGGQTWTQSLDTSYQIHSVTVSSDFINDGTIFVGTSNGIYKSTDSGQTWTQAGFTNISISSIAVSPDFINDRTIFVGTLNDIYKSTDSGQTWTFYSFGSSLISSIAISPNYKVDNTVFVGTQYKGIYKSTDGGEDWTQVLMTQVLSLAISPNFSNDGIVFIGGPSSIVSKSIDGGQTWIPFNNGLPPNGVGSIAISPDYANDSTVFVGAAGVYSHTLSGITHSIMASAGANGSISPSGVVSVNQNDSQIFTITPNANYFVADVLVDNVSVGSVTSYTFPNITADHTISAAFMISPGIPLLYSDNFDDGVVSNFWQPIGSDVIESNGMISIQENVIDTYARLESIAFPAASVLKIVMRHYMHPANNYFFPSVSFFYENSGPIRNELTWMRSALATDYCNAPNGFDKIMYRNEAGCVFSDLTSSNYYDGWVTSYIIYDINTGKLDYDIDGDGTIEFSADIPGQDRNPIERIAISGYGWATGHYHNIDWIRIYASISPTTTASPSGGTYSSAQNVTLTCNDSSGSGCQTTYYCLGLDCTPTTVYTGAINIASSTVLRFYSVDNDNNSESIKTETYTITLPPVTHTITASAGANGSISPSGAVSVNHNDSQIFTIAPNATYSVADVLVDGASVGAVTSYTFNTVTTNHTISASFVSVEPLAITTSSLASGTVGAAYNQPLTAAGGVPPYNWAISSGSLPTGLALNTTTGDVSGTLSAAGTFPFTVQVTDSALSTTIRNFSITVSDLAIRIPGPAPEYFPTVQNAYDACSDGNTIQIQASDLFEHLVLDHDIFIRLEGGYDPNFINNPSHTSINGTLIINNGKVVIENITIK